MTEPYLTEPIFCEYSRHHCIRPKHGDYKYCLQHIAEDKLAPYTSCQYVSRATKRKCPNPAPKSKTEKVTMPLLCSTHLQELLKKSNTRKKRKSKRRKMIQSLEPAQRAIVKQKHVLSKTLAKYADHGPAIVSDSSDFEEDENGFTHEFSQTSLIATDGVDHIESVSPVQNFDVMTDTEVLSVAQQKLVRLQSLYIEQFKSLNHELREARREFVVDSNKIIKGGKVDPVEEYHDNRRHGVEALLRLRYNRKRLQKLDKSTASQSGLSLNMRGELTSRCTHTEHHARCKGMSLPYTKYCSQHIMNDPHQQLYRECSWTNCKAAVCLLSSPSGVRSDDQTEVCCQLHAPLPPLTFKMPKEIAEMIHNKTTINQLGSSGENQCVDVESVETSPQSVTTTLTQITDSQNTPSRPTAVAAQHTDTPDLPQTTPMETDISDGIVSQNTQPNTAVSSTAHNTDNIPPVTTAITAFAQDIDKQSITSNTQNTALTQNTSEPATTLNETVHVPDNEKISQSHEKDIKKEISMKDSEADEKMSVDVDDCSQTTETKVEDGKDATDNLTKVESVIDTAEVQQDVGGEKSGQVSNNKTFTEDSKLGVKSEESDIYAVAEKMETQERDNDVLAVTTPSDENTNNSLDEKVDTNIPPTTTDNPAGNQTENTKELVDENSRVTQPTDTTTTASVQNVLPQPLVPDDVPATVVLKTTTMPPLHITHQSILAEDSPQRKLSDEDIAVSSLLTLSAAAHSEASDC